MSATESTIDTTKPTKTKKPKPPNVAKPKSTPKKKEKPKTKKQIQAEEEEAARIKAQEEENARLEAEAIAQEEARVAAAKLEEERLASLYGQPGKSASDEEKRKGLQTWLQFVPFADGPVGKIERDFSDGALVAEIIHYYCPELCDKRHFFKWYSFQNKISNWRLLNWKVFPKLGFTITETQMCNLMQPYACGKYEKRCESFFIYKLLEKIRDKLSEINPEVNAYKKKNSIPERVAKPRLLLYQKRKRMLEKQSLSKIEMLLQAGFYDKDGTDGEGECRSGSSVSLPQFPCSVFNIDDDDQSVILVQPSGNYCIPPPPESECPEVPDLESCQGCIEF